MHPLYTTRLVSHTMYRRLAIASFQLITRRHGDRIWGKTSISSDIHKPNHNVCRIWEQTKRGRKTCHKVELTNIRQMVSHFFYAFCSSNNIDNSGKFCVTFIKIHVLSKVHISRIHPSRKKKYNQY